MFEFFEGVIEKLGVKLIDDFSNKLSDYIANIKKVKIKAMIKERTLQR